MSCQNAPINSNVVPASDEYYRWDQTHVPQDYINQCEADPAGLPPTCGATMCDRDMVENMDSGYYRRPRYGREHRWGWNLPEYNHRMPFIRRPDNGMRWLPIGLVAALLFVMLNKK